jgi:hypothetical protein
MPLLWVRVNQRICFLPTVNNFPLLPPTCWLCAKRIIGGEAESGTLWKTVTLIYPDPSLIHNLCLAYSQMI